MKQMKINKKLIISILSIIIVIAVSLIGQMIEKNENKISSELENASLFVHYIDVGQGDAELIECNGEYMLIDAGENGGEASLIAYLREVGVKKLKYVVATHPHSDHLGGVAEVIEEFEVENVIMPKIPKSATPTTKTYRHFLDAVKKSGTKGIYAKLDSEYTIGDATFKILGPVNANTENLNDLSVVIKLTHGENTFFFSGDAEKEAERDLVERYGDELDCDVYKVAHHGSSTSSSKELMGVLTPEICIISCGEDNSYGHPHDETEELLYSITDKIYRTDICGTVIVSSDKQNYSVSYENQ